MRMSIELLENERDLVEELCRRLRSLRVSRILDVGCGTGKLALFLRERLLFSPASSGPQSGSEGSEGSQVSQVSQGSLSGSSSEALLKARELKAREDKACEIVGIDIDANKVAKARERAAEMCFSDVRFLTQPAERTSFEDGYFDAVVSLKALHELSDVKGSLEEAFRILRDGGRIYVIDWVRDTPTTRKHAHASLYFSEKSLVDEMRNAGFEDVRVKKSESGDLMLVEGLKKRRN